MRKISNVLLITLLIVFSSFSFCSAEITSRTGDTQNEVITTSQTITGLDEAYISYFIKKSANSTDTYTLVFSRIYPLFEHFSYKNGYPCLIKFDNEKDFTILETTGINNKQIEVGSMRSMAGFKIKQEQVDKLKSCTNVRILLFNESKTYTSEFQVPQNALNEWKQVAL
ncbi:hypothetical protein [Sporomusa aerivorans]|uniref:hypothetical protein n=1 Tax=Sporomusa aerivorans TaxID=204936 RepID=UPI00352A6554